MAKNGKVGKAIATAYVKDERDIPDYEFPDSGHVKLNLTTSDVAVLEGAASEPDMQSKSSTSLADMKKQIVEARLLATVAVLLSLGFICLLLNCFVWHAVRNAEMKQILLGILTFIVGMSTRDWYRLHGEKLTRALKALLNVSNMLNSFDTSTFDFFGICKCLKLNGKYTPEDLKINEGIPRTPETSPPLSPSTEEQSEIRNSAISKS
ncbi:Zinc finger, C2H2 type family protein [Brugia malayi]|uniref:Bm10764 n=2 Tax=Brugia malayi TaxID=6279 RepID=A0A0K0IPE2_BRUMA|nr:Zinc finger, C2H2 type family protein [Brugia malayi]CRZ25467.1 Bm10764 [Brugia malayi]VIO99688.1 Zinc finger, C2H2 type family protein [Brugia malayi]